MYLGDFAAGSVLDLKFTTVSSAGAPTQLAGTPAISIYKDNSTTQSTTGVTLSVDFDGVTGLNNLRVDTSADGTFYSAGSSFDAVITTGTVGGTSVVGYAIGRFTLGRAAAFARLGAPAGASIAADIAIIDDFLDTEIAAILAAVDAEVASILSAVDTEVAAIKTQTDKLVFTVANELDVNVQSINDTALTGNGAGTPWGPA